MKKAWFLYVPFIIISLWDCNGYFTPKEWDIDSDFVLKPVINGFIDPHAEVFWVSLEYNFPVGTYNEELYSTPSYSDVEITLIREDGVFKKYDEQPINPNDYRFDSTFFFLRSDGAFIQPGRKYTLEVNIDGMGQFNAKTTVPIKERPYRVISHSEGKDQYGESTLYVTIEDIDEPFSLGLLNTNFNQFYEINSKRLDIIYNEVNKEGQQVVEIYLGSHPEYSENKITTIETGYYDYLFELNKRVLSGSDPFSRYSPMPSNFEGGLGYFGSLNYDPDEGDNY